MSGVSFQSHSPAMQALCMGYIRRDASAIFRGAKVDDRDWAWRLGKAVLRSKGVMLGQSVETLWRSSLDLLGSSSAWPPVLTSSASLPHFTCAMRHTTPFWRRLSAPLRISRVHTVPTRQFTNSAFLRRAFQGKTATPRPPIAPRSSLHSRRCSTPSRQEESRPRREPH